MITLTKSQQFFVIKTNGYEGRLVNDIKKIPGHVWAEKSKVWAVPVAKEWFGNIKHLGYYWGLQLSDEVKAMVEI